MILPDCITKKTMIIQLNNADPKSKSFPFDTKPCRFIQKTKNQKNDWKLCQPLLHHQRVSLVAYLKYSVFQMSLL